MAGRKISEHTELTDGNVADADFIAIVDASDTAQSANGSTKKTLLSSIATWLASLAQTLTNKTIDAENNTITNIGDEEMKAGVDVAKIADGSVSNEEFQRLNGVTGGIQTQLDAKADASDLSDHEADTLNPHSVTADQVGAPSDAEFAVHTGDTTNPHEVTKTQVGLGNVTDDSQLKREAGDIGTFTEKAIPIDEDILLIEDSEDSNSKKKIQIGSLPSASASGVSNFPSWFGDGSDEDVTISSNTTLTDDKSYNNLTVQSGVSLDTSGYTIRVLGTLTVEGTIRNNGADGVPATTTVGAAGGAGGAGATLDAGVAGTNGASGSDPNGTNSTAGTSVNPSLGSNGAQGGKGGDGSGNTGGTGGAAGTATPENMQFEEQKTAAPTTVTAGSETAFNWKYALEGASSGATWSSSAGSSGGGSGIGFSSGGGGGGAGGSGGNIYISAKTITGTGTIEANGGNGGDGAGDGDELRAGGGGAGGSGGVVGLIYETLSANITIQTLGGTGGSGGPAASVFSAGTAGGNGNAGKIYKLKITLA